MAVTYNCECGQMVSVEHENCIRCHKLIGPVTDWRLRLEKQRQYELDAEPKPELILMRFNFGANYY